VPEVRDRRCGEATRRLTRSRPGPTNPGAWTAEDIDDLIHDVDMKVRPERIVLMANAADPGADHLNFIHIRRRRSP
jgi:hypothetical protein